MACPDCGGDPSAFCCAQKPTIAHEVSLYFVTTNGDAYLLDARWHAKGCQCETCVMKRVN